MIFLDIVGKFWISFNVLDQCADGYNLCVYDIIVIVIWSKYKAATAVNSNRAATF